MNTTTTRPSHPQPVRPSRPRTRSVPARRIGLIDRIALHVGIALVQWSRRSTVAVRHDHRATRVNQELAREQRERQMQRTMLLTLIPR
ncbi:MULTISPECIES: hypothetical protein [unclassified Microcella]|uniref:hypothetical protein n=1 Tax=unclassified Microcella TaxID=2630066 RepID=UPI0006FA8521|nr:MULTISPECIES: hypothetical protein [unclassified Microcella]KQV24556.1 hypothetical protein ASC54_08455 [Yonghaparkia sp. Root332]KRF30849.1 hypothetical protein ASG83_08285 [Yonghaparkia sp. Soil809]